MSSATTTVLVLLAIAAPLGAFDVAYFHLWKFRLYERAASRAETLTHLVRGLLFAAVSLVWSRYEPHGGWFWAVTALLVLDFLNTVADVLLEPRSRAALGGVPPAEYLIHIVGATFGGAVATAWIVLGWPLGDLPTALAPTTVSAALALNALIAALGAASLTVLEGVLWLRASRRTTAEHSPRVAAG